MLQTSKRYVFVVVLTWSRGSDSAHRFSCDRKLLASSNTKSDILCRFLSFRVFGSSLTSLFFSKQCQVARNCADFGCSSCRRSKGIGMSLSCPLQATKTTVNCEKRVVRDHENQSNGKRFPKSNNE